MSSAIGMSSLPTVLIFTYPEHGQANVSLATSYELALAGVNICVASFASLRTRVVRLQELIDRHASRSSGKPTGSVVFRECNGDSPYAEAAGKNGINAATLPHPCGVLGALESYPKIGPFNFAWGQEEYLDAIASFKEVIAITKPDMVGVDPLFFAAQDACKFVDRKFVIISPTGIKEIAVNVQPYLAAFWKYPALSSGFPFPLNSEPGLTYICPALTEIDFPFAVIPMDMILCGPIVMPFDPLEESDPALAKWLDNGPTVLINLGLHVVSNEKLAREMASAFRILLDYRDKKGSRKIQVLWKAKPDGDIQKVIDEIIGNEIKEERIKVVAWLDAEPVSILQHPSVVCTVHHGGANSFYEGIWSGVPHIVLPVWFDTYDYAQRAEFLNIGIFGSKTSAPGVRAEEFSRALVRVTRDSEEAVKFRTSAKRLKDVCRAKGNGRELATATILKETGTRK